MKKLFFLLLTVVVVVSLLAVPAQAAGSATITITADKTEVTPSNDTAITYTFTMSGVTQGIKSIQFDVTFPDELGQPTSAEIPAETLAMFPGGLGADTKFEDNYYFASAPSAAEGTKSDFTLLVVKFPISNETKVNTAFVPSVDVEEVLDGTSDMTQATVSVGVNNDAASVTVKHDSDADHHWQAGEVTNATCTTPKSTHYTCTTSGCQEAKDVTDGAALGHELSGTTFDWEGTTAENAVVKATVKCSHEGCAYYNNTTPTKVELTTSSVPEPGATCGAKGKVTWTAVGSVDGVEIKGTHTVETDTVMHDWNDATVEWKLDDPAQLSATATRTCKNGCGKVDTVTVTPTKAEAECTAPTCETPGKDVYTATFDFTNTENATFTQDAQKIKVTKQCDEPVTIPATGHDIKFYDQKGGTEDKFTWTDDGKATVYVECANAGCDAGYDSGKQVTVETFQDGKTDATCTKGGTVHYVGTISITDPKHETGAWTLTDTYERTVDPNGLGHQWEEKNIDWSGWTKIDKPFDATLKCSRCDASMTTTVTLQKDNDQSQAAGCTKPGKDVYTATADFTGKDPYATVKVPVPTGAKQTKENKIPALGHKWPEPKDVKFTWTDTDPTAPTAALSVSCQNKGCDTHYDTPQELTVSVAKTDSTDPKCAEDGSATWSATAKTPDGKVTYSEDGHETVLPKLGHDWGEPVFNWTEKDGKWDATEASRTCKRDAEHTDKANATVKAETTDATYTAAGKTVYTATAEFDGKVITDTKETTIPKLTASVKTNVPAANAGSGAEAALQSSTDALVDAVLSGTKPAGMPDNVYEALQDAAESDQSGLTVSTELVVSPTDTPSTIPGAVSAIDASIKITINNTDIEEYVPVSGNLTEVSEPITLKVPKPTSGGPIFWVVGIHNGNQSKLACTFSGNDILFSTAQFSTFVVVGSNDISNANVTGVDPSYAYTGAVIRPAVKVTINGDNETLTEGTDYTVEYKDNTNVGTATVTITGIGKYTGTVTKTFAITEKPVTATATPTPTATAAPSATSAAGAPATGDETPVALYAGMLVLSAAGLALVLRKRRPTDT